MPDDEQHASLTESMAKLGPRTTTHRATNGDHSDTSAAPTFGEWVDKWVAEHIPTAEAKAQQYGSNSLAKKGFRFATGQHQNVSLAQALELGVANYTIEKTDRIEDAILRAQLPSADTWIDVAIYALMAGYIRQHGRWV